jgi:uncharacterized membrane protein YkvI
MKDNEKVNWRAAIRLSGAFVATIIGSGFASGQELVQFFTVYGIAGALGAAAVSFAIYAVFSVELFNFGKTMPAEKQTAFFTVYFGEKVGAVLDWFCVIYIYGVFFIMLAGAGATLNQYFGVPNAVGSILMAVLCAITVLLGLKKLVDVMGTIGPLLIISTIVIGIYALTKNAGNLATVDETLPTMNFMKAAPNWFISGVLYPCFSFLTLTPVLPSMASQAPNKKTTTAAAITGCLGFHLALLALVFAMFANLSVLNGKMVPNIALATIMNSKVALVFSVMILLAIFSSACPMMWGTASKLFKDEKSKKYKLGTVGLIIGGMVVSYFFPLDVLINFIYGLTGYAGAAVMAAMFISKFVRKKRNAAIAEKKTAGTQE